MLAKIARVSLVVALAGASLMASPQRQEVDKPADAGQRLAPVANAPITAAPTVEGIPQVAPFYTLPLGDVAGPRVSFQQHGNVLTSIWMTPQGETYGRGDYLWDAAIKAFTGESSTIYQCLTEDGKVASTFQYQVKEQLYIVNARELRDRWTKPLDVDCSVGLVEKYRWYERGWITSDKDGKPLSAPQAPVW
jgi:hypothetical protein